MTADSLHFNCPHCQHVYCDDMEVLNTNHCHLFRCEQCAGDFYLSMMTCDYCEAASSRASIDQPEISALDQAICTSCNQPVKRRLEEDDFEEL